MYSLSCSSMCTYVPRYRGILTLFFVTNDREAGLLNSNGACLH